MKVLKITAKNLKLLMRSRTSMFVTIFGPLIIMLLVGFAFNNPSASRLNIGYYAPEKTNLTNSFVDALAQNQGFVLTEFSSEETCTDMIEQAKTHICIVFPARFELSNNNSNEVVFYVDQSRANFVYAILDTINTKMDLTSSQLSYQMTNDLLSTISYSQRINNENAQKIIALKTSLTTLNSNVDQIKSKLNNMDLTAAKVDTNSMLTAMTAIQKDVDTLKKQGYDVIDAGTNYASTATSNTTSQFQNTLKEAKSNINKTYNTSYRHMDDLASALDSLDIEVAALNTRLAAAQSATSGSTTELAAIQANVEKIKTDLDAVKAASEKVNAQINGLKVTSAESIVNPVTTRVETITAKSNNLNFIFPYLVMLMIVFISIMLSSTIIIIEKTSKAYFRNFATPTKDFTFIASVFLTSFFVIILQLILVLVLAYYFLNTTILTNIGLTLLTLLIAIILFTFLGMIIGYLFNSQEAVTMASISVGSILLFLSNLVLPLETMSSAVQGIARYNPYVVASELLKKVTLFSSEWSTIQRDFIIMGIFAVMFFILALIIQKMSKIQYISKRPIAKQIVKGKKDILIDKYFKLNNGILLRNEKELLQELKNMSDVTFEEYVNKNKNEFAGWLMLIENKELARTINKTHTRQDMIDAIENFNKKVK